MSIKISKITFAVTNMDSMVKFYERVLGVKLEPFDAYSAKFYNGVIAGVPIMFCPNSIAGVEAKQNRHQFDYIVENIDEIVNSVKEAGGKLMGDIEENDTSKIVSAIDPDGNTIVFIQNI